MKKILLMLLLFYMGLGAFADVLPSNVNDIPQGTIGVYQPVEFVKVYSKPDLKSQIVYDKKWSYLTVSNAEYADTLFALLKEKKELAFIYATDLDEDFVQIMYDKKKQNTGWAYKEDNFQFLPWITFYNMYGRKYGLKLLKGVPESVLELYSASSEDAQVLGKLNRPREIRLTAIQGNWALITALDIEGVAKTGYIRWRGNSGELYLFPAIK